MRKSVLCFLFLFLFLFSAPINVFADVTDNSLWYKYADTSFDGGDGTRENPYLIRTAEQLALFQKQSALPQLGGSNEYYENQHFKLIADIDLDGHWWTPISNFKGFFDGDNHVISNMYCRSTAGQPWSGSGFFGYINGGSSVNVPSGNIAVIENLHFKNANISANPKLKPYARAVYAGILAGHVCDARIVNCSSEGTVDGFQYNGGLIGKVVSLNGIDKTVIERCSSTARLDEGQYRMWCGGLIGVITAHGTASSGQVYISDCWTGGNINMAGNTENAFAGGLVGYIGGAAYGVSINRCYSYSDISGDGDSIGGLIGLVNISEFIDDPITGMVEISNSAALNTSLASSREKVEAGRLIGNSSEVAEAGKCSIENTYALDVMSVLGRYTSDDSFLSGTDLSKETLVSGMFWEDTLGFDFIKKPIWIENNESTSNTYPLLNQSFKSDNLYFFISTNPVDTTAYRGFPAVFGVVAGGGAMGYAYQWEYYNESTKEWIAIDDELSDTLKVAYNSEYANGTKFHCVVTDQIGQIITSDAAVLSLTSAKYTPNDALDDLISYYDNKSSVKIAKELFGLATVKDDFSDYTIDNYFWAMYTDREQWNYSTLRNNFPYALMDGYVRGMDPHSYFLDGENDASYFNLLERILSFQNSETGQIYGSYSNFPIKEHDFPALILGLEMYFDGSEWGNEKEGTKLGRDGAIEYFFSSLHEHSSGGLIYNDFYTGSKNNKYHIRDQRCLAEAAILAARLVDDPQWGKQAEDALSGLMKTLEYLYDTREEVSDNSGFVYTESQARYVSALIAAGNATDNWFKKTSYFNLADEIVEKNDDSILNSKSMDGTYSLISGDTSMTGDAEATAAVMMALGDYENQSSILMDYVFEVPDADAAANDLAAIVIDSPVTGDLELAATGAYGSAITWETSDKSVISASGKVTRGAEDQSVTLTATATRGDAVATRSFVLTVKAKVSNAAEDALDAVLNGLNVPIETTHDITLGESADPEVALTWATSAADVLGTDGKVVRPAVGSADAEVTLTATATKGELSKSKEFTVQVYAETGDNLKEAYYLTRDKYLNDRSLGNYWQIWAAYAALGDYITDSSNGYSFGLVPPSTDWYGTQYGASVNAIVAMGENPYNYQGKNWVKMLQDNYGGPFAGPTYSELGMEAAGADSDYGFTASAAAGISAVQPESMAMGIDIAGWATTILGAHKGEEGVDEASKSFINHLKTECGVAEDGNFTGVNFISTGCGIMGMAALYSVGYEEADVTTWKNETTGKTPVDAVWDQCFMQNEKYIPNYDEQIEIALCDLYNAKYKGGTSAWVSCRVSGAKLAAQEAAAGEILANAEAYEAESIEAIKTALAATAEISEERRSANIADYGEEYYALYDAVRYAALIGQGEKDAEAAAAVSETLTGLKDASALTLSDKAAVEAARGAYNALTDKQKELVDEAALAKLEAAEAAIAALDTAQGEAAQAAADKAAAKAVKNAINALPSEKDLLGSDAAAVEAARAAYDALSEAQKALVPEKTVAKLEAAEARMEALAGLDVVDIGAMTDVKESDWFYGDVAYALGNGLFKGMTATTFGPEASMTRGQFVTVLGRYAGVEDSSAAYPQQTIYSDVSANEYYAAHVKWATDNGITVGTSATTFSPEAEITRQDMSVMMLRFAKAMGITLPAAGDALFADDAAIADYAREAVYRMKAAGIVNGMGDNKFMPQEKSRRCEVAAVLHRFFTMEDPEDAVDTVVVSVEKFTLGQGYVVEPTVMELEEGDTAESVIYRLLEEEGIEYRCKTNYLIGIRDNDTSEAVFPQYILDQVEAEGGSLEERLESGWLKEFDYSSSSGWMFWVNNREPVIDGFSPGIAQYVMQPGDVMRFQFTVIGLGKDLGADGYGEPYVRPANKDALTVAAAKCNDKTSEAYQNALKVLMNMESTQAEVDAAAAALQ